MFLCLQATSLSWFWHCTVHNLVWFVSITKHEWFLPLVIFRIGSHRPGRQSSHPLCPSRVDCMDAIYRARQVHVLYMLFFSFLFFFFVLCYFTGESLFSSFFPLESSPFFFLFARSWESRGSRVSSGMRGPLEGLRGLMVPGRRGRTIGDGARTGATLSLSTVAVVSVAAWGERRWGEVWRHGGGGGGQRITNEATFTLQIRPVCLSVCLHSRLNPTTCL